MSLHVTTRAERLKSQISSIGADAQTEAGEKSAIDVLRGRCYDTVRGIAKEVLQAVLDGETDVSEVSDRIHESVDSACIYTSDCYMMAWLLDTADDVEDFVPEEKDPSAIVTGIAFANLRGEVEQMVQRCLSEADWETEDEEQEDADAEGGAA